MSIESNINSLSQQRGASPAFAELLQVLSADARDKLYLSVPRLERYFSANAVQMLVFDLESQLEKVAGLSIESSLAASRSIEQSSFNRDLTYDGFLEGMFADKGQRTRTRYPALSGLLRQVIRNWLRFNTLMLKQFMHDHSSVKSPMRIDGKQNGKVVSIECARSDRHNGGSTTTIFHFASGKAIVYKPRSLRIAQYFTGFLRWLNQRDSSFSFYITKMWDRGSYGWMEYLPNPACNNTEDVSMFYYRAGGLLRVLQLLNARDCHFENMIAFGSHPVLIDHEMLFQPEIAGPYEVGNTPDSMRQIGFLPNVQEKMGFYYDVSAMGGTGGDLLPYRKTRWKNIGSISIASSREHVYTQRQSNLPHIAGEQKLIFDFDEEFINGFKDMHELLVGLKDELSAASSPMRYIGSMETRFVFRPTRAYTQLRTSCFQPRYLKNRDTFEERLSLLDTVFNNPEAYRFRKLASAEKEALRNLDIPRFMLFTNRKHVYWKNSILIKDVFRISGEEVVQQKISTLQNESVEEHLAEISRKIQRARSRRNLALFCS